MLTSREVRGGTIELIILIKPKDTGYKKSKRRRDTGGNVYAVGICLFGREGESTSKEGETEDQEGRSGQ